jgi:hypothetical protein
MGAFAQPIGIAVVDEHRFINPRQPVHQHVMHHPVGKRCGVNFTQFGRGNYKSQGAGGLPGGTGKTVARRNQLIRQTGFIALGIAGVAFAFAAGLICPPQRKQTKNILVMATRQFTLRYARA